MSFSLLGMWQVLTARIDEGACGWFVATVVSDAVGKKDKKKTPTA